MKHPAIILALAVAGWAACGLSDSTTTHPERRYTNKAQGYSLDEPDGWSPQLVRGFAQFAPKPASSKRGKHRIVVRTAERSQELNGSMPATRDAAIAATERVLRAMPRAKLGAKRPVRGSELSGVQFSMTFVPPGVSTAYRREHVTLLAAKRLYHIIYTAPDGEPIDEAALKSMVSTLSDEG